MSLCAIKTTGNMLNLYCPDLILHLQGQTSQYTVSWHICLGFTSGNMLVALCHKCVTYIYKRLMCAYISNTATKNSYLGMGHCI